MTREEMMERVGYRHYAQRKWYDLKQFGYAGLSLDDVQDQLLKVINKEKDLTVIGMFIKNDFDEAQDLLAERKDSLDGTK